MTAGPVSVPVTTVASGGRRRVSRRLVFAAVPLVAYVVVAVVGPWVLPYDPVATATGDRLRAPGTLLADGTRTWLGTDQLGRDLLAQVVAGARISLTVAVATVAIGGLLGAAVGLLAGYFGRWWDAVTMRVADIQLAFPGLLLAILIAAVLGPSVRNVIITLAVTRWVSFARVARASALAVRGRDFVASARVIGAGHGRILTRYILPQAAPPLLVLAAVEIGLVVLSEASLSFLGLGVPLDEASWGATIANGRDYLGSAWWIATIPGIALAGLVLSVSVLSDELGDSGNGRA